MKNRKFILSKSKFLQGKQCTKLLYLAVNKPELLPEVSTSQQAVFDQGHEVGLAAQKLFPNGCLIEADYHNPDEAIQETEKQIQAGALTLFEAAFAHDEVLVRVDILTRKTKTSPWEIIEVKSSTDIKEVNLPDIALQTWVVKAAGLEVGKQFLMHLNKECVYPDLSMLFTKLDVTNEIKILLPEVSSEVKFLKKVLNSSKEPANKIGKHCDDPYECPLKDHCWKDIPTPSVFDIPRLASKKKWDFFERGIVNLKDVPIETLNETQQRMHKYTLQSKPYIDHDGIKKEMSDWQYPLSFFDFETINPAIPKFPGNTPYTQVPFQFSCHVIESKNSKIKHFEFLFEEDCDPRPALIESLLSTIPEEGSVIAYNAGFEKNVLQKLAEFSPKHSSRLGSIADRLVDLLPVVRNNVYHKDFLGSFSIKYVAPALFGNELSYEEMFVGDGVEAQSGFGVLCSTKFSKSEKAKMKDAMLAYCKQDTWAMVRLYEWLAKMEFKKAA